MVLESLSHLHEGLYEGRRDPPARQEILAQGAEVDAAHLVGQVEHADHLDELLRDERPGRLVLLVPVLGFLELDDVVLWVGKRYRDGKGRKTFSVLTSQQRRITLTRT